MNCKKCKHNLFKIKKIQCCDDCENNGAWDEDYTEYTYDILKIERESLERSEVNEQGECSFGSAFGKGCHMYICAGCGHKTNMPFVDA